MTNTHFGFKHPATGSWFAGYDRSGAPYYAVDGMRLWPMTEDVGAVIATVIARAPFLIDHKVGYVTVAFSTVHSLAVNIGPET